jgi:hypothetical protein
MEGGKKEKGPNKGIIFFFLKKNYICIKREFRIVISIFFFRYIVSETPHQRCGYNHLYKLFIFKNILCNKKHRFCKKKKKKIG